MSTAARSVLCLLTFAVIPGSLSAEQFDLQLEYFVIGFVDSPELLPSNAAQTGYT